MVRHIHPNVHSSSTLFTVTKIWEKLCPPTVECIKIWYIYITAVVQSLSHVQLFARTWTAARQASQSFTIFQSCICVCLGTKSLQSCPILCDPMDHSPPGPSVPGILLARILKWLAVPSFRDRPDPEIEPVSPTSYTLATKFFTTNTTGSISGSGRSLEEDMNNPLKYSCQENPMDRGAGQATVHGIAKSQT